MHNGTEGSNRPFLSIVIPTLTPSKSLKLLLDSIQNQIAQFHFEILVVANPHPLPQTTFYNFTVPIKQFVVDVAGVNRARRQGIMEAQGTWVYLLDDDCSLLAKDHLEVVFSILQNAAEQTLFGGGYRLSDNASRWSNAYHLLQRRWIHEGEHPNFGATHLFGGNLIFHRSAMNIVSFDESIEFGGSETDWLMRLVQNGYRGQFEPRLDVGHYHSLSREVFLKKASMQGYGLERLICRDLKLPKFVKFIENQIDLERFKEELELFDIAFQFGRSLFLTSPDSFPHDRWEKQWSKFFKNARIQKQNEKNVTNSRNHKFLRDLIPANSRVELQVTSF